MSLGDSGHDEGQRRRIRVLNKGTVAKVSPLLRLAYRINRGRPGSPNGHSNAVRRDPSSTPSIAPDHSSRLGYLHKASTKAAQAGQHLFRYNLCPRGREGLCGVPMHLAHPEMRVLGCVGGAGGPRSVAARSLISAVIEINQSQFIEGST